MASHSTSSVQETADRLAIGELIDAYAHCADRRDAKGQMNLFTDDTRFVVYMEATSEQPTQELRGREALAPVFDDLNTYAATFHFNGQRTVAVDFRYLDAFVKQVGAWWLAVRRLMVDWTETRPFSP
jgi:SnoaL-like domain